MKISDAQLIMLRRIAREGDLEIRHWGTGFGLRRSSIAALAGHGLLKYYPGVTRDISCCMTSAGYAFLKAMDDDESKKPEPTDTCRQSVARSGGLGMATSSKLVSGQRQVLAYLVENHSSKHGHSGRDISSALGHRAAYWASEKLRVLERRGLVKSFRTGPTGAYLYHATTAEMELASTEEESSKC